MSIKPAHVAPWMFVVIAGVLIFLGGTAAGPFVVLALLAVLSYWVLHKTVVS